MNIKENCLMYSFWQDFYFYLLFDFFKMFSMFSNLVKVGIWIIIKISVKVFVNFFFEIDLVDYF